MYKDAIRAAWAEINITNLDYNIKQIKDKVGPGKKITGIIKADAYGHGAIKVATVLRANGIESFGVATLSEAVRLRKAGFILEEIIVLGLTPDPYIDTIIEYRLTPVFCDYENAEAISRAAAKANIIINGYLAIDTGMGRIGYDTDNSSSIDDIRMIMNLPSTVEMTTPNVYADQIEWMHTHFKNRESIILSVHPHNDRGCGISDAEFGVLAGADRVEGTLFGNGERTGNVDIVTLAMNMVCHGVDPKLDFSNIAAIREKYERFTRMRVYERTPYAGDLVFTAFSGSHQDAINKGMQALHERNGQYWEVPYLPIDPSDIGREYEPIVRINSQSGKGGVAFVMDTFYGFKLPKGMHKEFADVIQKISEQQGEVAPEQIMEEFRKNYLDKKEPIHFRKCQITDTESSDGEFATLAKVIYTDHGMEKSFEGVGNGPIDAVQRGLEEALGVQIKVLDYNEHALNSGSNAQAASYIHLMDKDSGKVTYGVGVSSNITRSSIRGIFSAVNRLFFS